MARFAFITLLLSLAPSLLNAACFAPNGALELNTAYQPCIQVEGIHSMCCATNRTLVGGTADKCQQNGLCLSADGGSWRGFCTDRNWNSPGCLGRDVCSDVTGGTSSNSNELTKCQDGTYCCNGGNTTCCSRARGFTLNPTLISIQTAREASSSSSPIGTPTATPSPTCSPLASDALDKGTNATVIGVGIGVPLAAISVVGSLLSFWLGQKRGRRTHTALATKDDGSGSGVGDSRWDYKPYGLAVAHENGNGAGHEPGPQELRGQGLPAEMGEGNR